MSLDVKLVIAGVLAGSAAAALIVIWIAAQLYGISARDPMVFAVVPTILIAVSVGASWLPARRAARVDPQIAVRSVTRFLRHDSDAVRPR